MLLPMRLCMRIFVQNATMSFGRQQTVAGIVTITSGVLALACMITGMVALNYNFDAFSDPMLILNMHDVNVGAKMVYGP